MIYSNFHTHTFRCGHATGTDEEYVLKAIEAGIKTLGFADHEEITEPNFYRDGLCTDYTADYIDSLTKLKEKYKNQINIHIGLESTYFEGQEEHLKTLYNSGIEYLLLGQHEVYNESGNRQHIFKMPYTPSIIDKYVRQVTDGIKSGIYSYLNHPDFFMCIIDEITPHVKDAFYDICKCAKEYETPLEVNLLGFTRTTKYTYPNDKFFKIASEIKNEVIIGVDAHTPEAFLTANYKNAENLIERYNLKQVHTIDLSRFKNVLKK